MGVDAHEHVDQEIAAAETGQPPSFEAQFQVLPGGDLGLASAWRIVLDRSVGGGFRGPH